MEALKRYISNLFGDNFYFDKYLTYDNVYQNIVCVIIDNFIENIDIDDYRKECLNKFGYDIILIDVDIYGVHACGDELNQIKNIDKNILSKIIVFLKRHFNYTYLFYSNKNLGVIMKKYPSKKIHKKALYRFKKFIKKNNIGIDFIEY